MRIKDIKEYLKEEEQIPEDPGERKKWFEMEDALIFLLRAREGVVPMYISGKDISVYSVVVPEEKLIGNYIDDLLNWEIVSPVVYSYATSSKGAFLCDPMDCAEPKILEESTPVFFIRECNNHTVTSFEINQKISHILEICWSEKRKAFCKLDELGDTIEIATIEDDDSLTLCTLKKEDLDLYLYLSKSVLIRVFDVKRTSEDFDFPDEDSVTKTYKNPHEETFAKLTTHYNDKGKLTIAYLKGFQVIRNRIPDDEMMKRLGGKEDRDYESFLILDWKNKELKEWPSDPKKIGNYFIDSDLPFETSPAFFRSEVLAKYKQNPDKYTIEYRKINCRGAWSLRYDINDEDQVFVYIKDISHLPYKEQQYWKSFNEKPKVGISKRTLRTDFEGKWDMEYDPLTSFKDILENFPDIKVKGKNIPLWKMPNLPKTRDIHFLNYVVTDSTKEWEDQISAIYQILIEGLQAKNIKLIANNLECREKGLKSVKQLIKCLEALNIHEETIDIIVMPLFELIDLRSKLVAHTTSKEYPEEDLKVQYRNLLEKCDKSMRKLADLINQGVFNIEGEN